MTGRSIPAQGGVTDDPIRIGTMLYTLVEPHRGHQVAYNRWYERDHFYAGCQIGAYNFAGARFVATAPLKGLRYPGDGAGGPSPLVPDPQVGSLVDQLLELRCRGGHGCRRAFPRRSQGGRGRGGVPGR